MSENREVDYKARYFAADYEIERYRRMLNEAHSALYRIENASHRPDLMACDEVIFEHEAIAQKARLMIERFRHDEAKRAAEALEKRRKDDEG